MKKPALAILARAPVPGQVKTRLQPPLKPKLCADLYMALLCDTLDLVLSVPQYTPFLAFTPQEARFCFESFVPEDVELVSQTGDNLGDRMHNLMCWLETRGHSPVVIIGSDIPLLRSEILLAALERLTRSELCFGPSSDGGYYLVGARHADSRIFTSIPWSTPDVLKMTLEDANKARLSFGLLDEVQDVDTFRDLTRLEVQLRRLRETPGARIPLRTEAWLTANKGLWNGKDG